MNLIEIVSAHSLEHKRRIRQMARDVMGCSPITMALCEIGTGLFAGGLLGLFVLLFVRWWMGL